MKHSDFYNAELIVKLKKKTVTMPRDTSVFTLYLYRSSDGELSYAITADGGNDNFSMRCFDSFDDALTVFTLITENNVDANSFGDIADDYYYSKKIYNM